MPRFCIFRDKYLRNRKAWGPEIFSEVLEYRHAYFPKVSWSISKVDIFHCKGILPRKCPVFAYSRTNISGTARPGDEKFSQKSWSVEVNISWRFDEKIQKLIFSTRKEFSLENAPFLHIQGRISQQPQGVRTWNFVRSLRISTYIFPEIFMKT